MYTLRWLSLAAVLAATERAQSQAMGSVVAIVTSREGPAAPYSVVTIDGRGRFTDESGRVRIDSVLPGTSRVRVEHTGFLSTTTGVTVRAGGVDTLRVALNRFRPNWRALKSSSEPRCGGSMGAAKDSLADAVIEQVRINARVNQVLTRDYPFQYVIAREISEGHRGSAKDTNLTFAVADTALSGSARYWRYSVGSIEAAIDQDSLEERGWLSPLVTLSDMADRAFDEAHCYTYKGIEAVNGRRLLRIEIGPVRRITVEDVFGVVHLDTASFVVRRLFMRADRSQEPQGLSLLRNDSLFVESVFREIVPSVAMIDSVEMRRRSDYRLGLGAPTEAQTASSGALPNLDLMLGAAPQGRETTRHREHVVAITSVGGGPRNPSPLQRFAAAADSAARRFADRAVLLYSDSVRAAVHGFVNRWRTAWEGSEAQRHPVADLQTFRTEPTSGIAATNLPLGRRGLAVVCHIDASEPDPNWNPFRDHAIQSGAGKRAICPTWQFEKGEIPDEARNIDAGILPRFLPAIVTARDSLIAALANAQRRRPTEAWVVGQRVRFAVDQRLWSEAVAAIATCGAERWWCLELDGYVRHARGDEGGSDLAFARALAAMPTNVRCEWTDFSALLSWRDAKEYQGISCEARQAVNERLWWMSDPLWSDAGNDRRNEQYSRMVLARLRSEGPLPERWETRPRYGGLAFIEMIARYGWPTTSWWAGPGADQAHYDYVGVTSQRRRRLGIFTTAEYSVDRPHTVPTFSAIQDPIHAQASDWFLAPPRESLTGAPDGSWWPVEHFRRDRGMLFQLFEQTAMFRRQDGALIAVATQPHPDDLGLRSGDTVETRFVIAASADSFEVIRGRAVAGRSAVLQTTMKPRVGYVLSFEAFRKDPDSAGPAARTRYGVTPPPPLSEMKPGDIAISPPAFVRPPAGPEEPVTEPRAALARMYPNATFAGAGRVGFYFETYGIKDGDSAFIAVTVFRRGKDSVTVSWQEPSTTRAVTTTKGDVPIQSRNITFDLTPYEPGDYIVRVTARLRGKVATAERDLTIAPPGAFLFQYRAEEAPIGKSEEQWVEALVGAAQRMHLRPDYRYGRPSPQDELTRMVMKRLGVTPATSLVESGPVLRMTILNPTTDRATVLATILDPNPNSEIVREQVGCFDVRPNAEKKWTVVAGSVEYQSPAAPLASFRCRKLSEWY